MVRLWPVLGLVMLMVAPFPWGALAAPAEPVANDIPAASPKIEEEPRPPLDLYWYTTRTPLLNATFDMIGPGPADRTGFVRVLYRADQIAVPLAGVTGMRTAGGVAQPTWSQVSFGAAPAQASATVTVVFTSTGAHPAPAGAAAPAAAPASTFSAPAPASSTATSTPAGPLNVPAGGVSELLSRIPPDLGARPYRFLRLLGRGLSLVPFALFRFRPRDGLDQETRRLIYAYLREHPGALAGQIADQLGLRRQTIIYHLGVLMHEGLVISHANGRRHYFRRDDPQRVDTRNVLSPATRTVLDMLPDAPVTAQELAERVGLKRRTVQWHLGRLRDHGLVRGLRSRHGTRYVRTPGSRHHFRSV